MARPGRPFELTLRLALYILRNRLRRRRRFPLVTMLEPLEMCNLSCTGCGRIREYEAHIDRVLSVEEALRAVEEAGAPVVSVAGGEPLIHPHIIDIVEGILKRRRFVYLCTNGLLMERALRELGPSRYLCWVVHLDGMEERHDEAVGRRGVFRVAMRAIEAALEQGHRVCTNTTIYKGSDVEDLHRLFRTLAAMGIEGCMVSPAFDFQEVPERDLFLSRHESIQVFRRILDRDETRGVPFYNNPLYLDFLRGERDYQCAAWSNPTYTILGWRKPCYQLADTHTQDIGELFQDSLWERYGVGRDPRCANCMMHSGFEAATIFKAFTSPKDWFTLIKAGAPQRSAGAA